MGYNERTGEYTGYDAECEIRGMQHGTCPRCGKQGWFDDECDCGHESRSENECEECGKPLSKCKCTRCLQCEELVDDCKCEVGAMIETFDRLVIRVARKDHKDGKIKKGDRYKEHSFGGYYIGGRKWVVCRCTKLKPKSC